MAQVAVLAGNLQLFYMFINTSVGEEVKRILNDLFPGLIKEPKRVPVRVPVPQPEDGRRRDPRYR